MTAGAPWRRRERPRGAALKPYRKFSHGGGMVDGGSWIGGDCVVPFDDLRAYRAGAVPLAIGGDTVALVPRTVVSFVVKRPASRKTKHLETCRPRGSQ